MKLATNTLPRDHDEMTAEFVDISERELPSMFSLGSIQEDSASIEDPQICMGYSSDCIRKFIPSTTLENFKMRLMEDLDIASYGLFRKRNGSADFLIATIEDIIVSYEQLPVSYNSIMIRGALRYCAKLLDSVEDLNNLLKKIKKFIFLVNTLCFQIETPTSFVHLDLTYIENLFESIEEEAVSQGYLPPMEAMPI